MHVPAGGRHQARWHTRSADENGVGVGAGAPTARFEGERDVVLLGRLVQELEHLQMQVRAAGYHGAGAQAVLGDLTELDARLIGGERHVHRDGYIRPVGEGAGSGSGQASFLLGHRQGEYLPGRPAGLRDDPGGLLRHVTADAVVDRPRHHTLVGEVERLARNHRHVAYANQAPGFVAVGGPDVDVELLELGDLLALLLLE